MYRPKNLLKAVEITLQNYGVAIVCGIFLLFLLPQWLRYTAFYAGGVFYLATLVVPFVDDWRPKGKIETAGKAVFISGCDTGFGHLLALRLDQLGFHVFAGCLFPEGEGAAKLRKAASSKLHTVPLDVSEDASVESAKEYTLQNLGNNVLWAVVNNAGINEGAELLWTNMDAIKRVMEVNTFGVVRVTKAFLPHLCQSKGRVVAVASAAGRYTYPGMVPYCMSKQSVISFCDGLRLELYRFGVKVITVEPWMYRTPITDEDHILGYIGRTWDRAPQESKDLHSEDYIERYKEKTVHFITYSYSHKPQEVASCLEEAVVAVNPKYSYNPGVLFSRLSFWLIRRLPKSLADLVLNDHCVVRL